MPKDEQPEADTPDTWNISPEEDDFLIESIGLPGRMFRERQKEQEEKEKEEDKRSPKANEDSSTSPPTDQP